MDYSNYQKSILSLVRPCIAALSPYTTARDDFKGKADIYLDANESPYANGCNRYPDPRQQKLKSLIGEKKGINPCNLFLGNGSDEAIDLLMRIFAEPGKHNVVAIVPSYGMYGVSAAVNNLEVRQVLLNDDFSLPVGRLLDTCDADTRIMFICSPNNPTGNAFARADISRLAADFNGILVVDEAYVDFSSVGSMKDCIGEYPNLVVLQTLSKAWGMAGLRIGLAIAVPEIIEIMSNVKYPYNISEAAMETAVEVLNKGISSQVEEIISQRDILARQLAECRCIRKVYPSDANFLLVKTGDADRLYAFLSQHGIIVRNRNSMSLCEGCLRITVGLPSENRTLIETIKRYDRQQ